MVFRYTNVVALVLSNTVGITNACNAVLLIHDKGMDMTLPTSVVVLMLQRGSQSGCPCDCASATGLITFIVIVCLLCLWLSAR